MFLTELTYLNFGRGCLLSIIAQTTVLLLLSRYLLALVIVIINCRLRLLQLLLILELDQ